LEKDPLVDVVNSIKTDDEDMVWYFLDHAKKDVDVLNSDEDSSELTEGVEACWFFQLVFAAI
jgi:hypothetical protein